MSSKRHCEYCGTIHEMGDAISPEDCPFYNPEYQIALPGRPRDLEDLGLGNDDGLR